MSLFNFDNSAVTLLGTWEYCYVNSQRALNPAGAYSSANFAFTGTQLSFWYSVTALGINYLQVSIDGGAFTNVTLPGSINTPTKVTLATGLSEALHTVTIKHEAGTNSNITIQVVNGIEVIGAAPALSLASGFGPYYLAIGQLTRWASLEGIITFDNTQGHLRLAMNAPNTAITFRANPTSIKVFANLQFGSKFAVFQDGVQITTGVALTGAGDQYGLITLASGLDGQYHTYTLENCLSAGTPYLFLVGVMLMGGDIDKTNDPIQKGAIAVIGDSICAGNGTGDTSLVWVQRVARAKGYQTLNFAMSGQTCLANNTTILYLSAEGSQPVSPGWVGDQAASLVKYIVVNIGHNDSGDAAGEFQASLIRLFKRLKDCYTGATILAVPPFNTTGYSGTIDSGLRSDYAAAVVAVPGVLYLESNGVIVPGTDTVDGTHPNAAGETKMATWLSPYILPFTQPVRKSVRCINQRYYTAQLF